MVELAVWQIYVIEYARLKDHPWVDFINGMYHEGTVNLPFSFILAQRGERNVLIDTGFMQDDRKSTFPLKFGVPMWISPVRMLREMKLGPEAITDIVITHAHFDHMGSIAEFPNARIYIQKSELLFLVRSLRPSGPLRPSHRDRRPRQYPLRSRRLDRPSLDPCRRRQERCDAGYSRPAWKRTYDRTAIRRDRDRRWPPGHLG